MPSHDSTLLWWCFAGSIAAHVLLLQWLPGWQRFNETHPPPLNVELREPTPEIVLPKPMPVETRPQSRERPQPAPVKRALREEPPVEQPRAAPILTAPPEAPVTAAIPVAPEQKPALAPEPPRPPPVPVAAPAPATPPRFDAKYLYRPMPDYPLAAKRRGESGTLLLRVLVTPEGNPGKITIDKSSGSSLLDDTAVRAVREWKFVPHREGDKPVQGEITFPFIWNLKRE
ncbi:MAG TPA: energy transducer TonB [Burkholderiales bacterium]|nr:energy transducer TonB [Burkholderiales bacterium]